MAEQQQKVAEFIELRSAQERLPLVCRYVRRRFESGGTVSVYVPDDSLAEELDTQLWTFAQDAFIPHVRLEEADAPLIEPVVIFGGDPGEAVSDVLVLCVEDELPEWFELFPHIYDFAAVYDEELRAAGRRRYQACKDAGYHMRFIRP